MAPKSSGFRAAFRIFFFFLFFSLFTPAVSTSSCEPIRPRPSRRLLQSTMLQQFLVPHNLIRGSLGLPPLQWSDALAGYASWWASQRSGDCALVHSDSDYGENIFWGAGAEWQPGDTVAAWAAESSFYDYGSNSCQPDQDCSHYTQIVWRNSLRIGCAQIVCTTGDTFITCNYDPHGNVMGQRPF
ncbi:pathogenesis-related protein PR-1-like [Ananas comosus]|uniref:Pathogenesis-related protein PR-1-like n=1 Tax=Ananas comosus TaxID=4615 RepID=A0A6P5F835_ANACO|nr:pathogenesis-related protein PR-1-like [Ananas comosus]